MDPIVKLDVGGTKINTSLSTLTKYRDTMLANMFAGDFAHTKTDKGRIFIDFDGTLFNHLLQKIRFGTISEEAIPKGVERGDWILTLSYFGFPVAQQQDTNNNNNKASQESGKKRKMDNTQSKSVLYPRSDRALFISSNLREDAKTNAKAYHNLVTICIFKYIFESEEFQKSIKSFISRVIIRLPKGTFCHVEGQKHGIDIYDYLINNGTEIAEFFKCTIGGRIGIAECQSEYGTSQRFNGETYFNNYNLELVMVF